MTDLPDEVAGWVGDRRPVPVGSGQSGAAVFRVTGYGADWYLKLGTGAAAGLVADEAARLRWLAGRVPSSEVVDAGAREGTAWLLTGALHGVSAADYVRQDRGRAVAVATALAGFLRRLHALPVDDCPFDASVAGWLPVVRALVADGLVDTDDFDPEHAGWSAQRVLDKVERLAGEARGRVVVHGDFSLGNVILTADGAVAGCIDVGLLGVGDPYRDLFIGWRDLGAFGAAAQGAFLAALGVDALEPTRRELHRALDELF